MWEMPLPLPVFPSPKFHWPPVTFAPVQPKSTVLQFGFWTVAYAPMVKGSGEQLGPLPEQSISWTRREFEVAVQPFAS